MLTEKTYILSSDKSRKFEKNIVIVSEKKELEILLFILGEDAKIDTGKNSSAICAWSEEINEIDKIKLSFLDKTKILTCLRKIKPKTLKLKNTQKINKTRLHKTKRKDVMISEVVDSSDNKLFLFLGNPDHTNEIFLDHTHTDHVEAIFLTEICRQAAIATVIPESNSNNQFYILEEFKKYEHIVKRNKKVAIQTVLVQGKGGLVLCFFSLYQSLQCCLTGYFLGMQKK